MPRRGENIYKRKDGRWEGRYIENYDLNGKAKYHSVYGHTYADVRLKMQQRPQYKKTARSDIKITDWVKNYLNSQNSEIKISTFKVYERYLNNHIEPFFKNIKLQKLSEKTLQEFINSLSELAPSTIRGIFSFLRESLKEANKKGYVSAIWLKVELPKEKKPQTTAFTKEEQRLIENSLNIEKNPNEIGIYICLYTGLRIGEVCGLRWTDIDFKSKILTVNRTVQRMTVDGKSILCELPPKSDTSCRKIPIPTFLCGKLKDIKEKSASAYVLNTDSHIMDPRTFQYQFKKILNHAGVAYANAHTLRHTFSVRALETGFDVKTLSEILGHANAATTLKNYAHSLDEHKRNSMERLGNVMI